MPELPEVQTIVNGLKENIINKEIIEIIEYRDETVFFHTDIETYGKILSVGRRGKYIILQTTQQLKIVIHLRMTGKLIFEANPEMKSSHTRAEIVFADETKLIFDDIRTFGKIELISSDESLDALDKLGKEPLSDAFDYQYLQIKTKGRKSPVKNILMNQEIIAGLGNIYAAEILFRCKINPKTPISQLSKNDFKKIVKQTKEVLQEAILHNGTTISDYRSVEDKTGEFQNFLNVYGKDYCNCGTKIEKIKQAGRTTFYCPECQPEKL